MPKYLAPGVYVEEGDPGANPIEGVDTSTAAFVGETKKGPTTPTLITSFSGFTQTFGGFTWPGRSDSHLAHAVYGFFLNGGSRCYIGRVVGANWTAAPTLDDYKGTDGGPGQRTGLIGFEDVDEIAIVCAPNENDVPGLTDAVVTHCESKRDRLAVLQSKLGTKGEGLHPPRDSKYAAFYFPWLKVSDPAAGGTRLIPPGGHIAGVYARSDSSRGVHKAPANEVVLGALDLEVSIGADLQDELNPRGVNCIRFFPGRGLVVWGARTMTSDPEWRYVNIRRLFMYLEESIEKGTQWVVFEPNAEPLWARVRRSVENFLTTAWRNGALMGTKADEAFFVRCDRTTMTNDDIENGRLIVLIGVAPIRPAEFTVFRISHLTRKSE